MLLFLYWIQYIWWNIACCILKKTIVYLISIMKEIATFPRLYSVKTQMSHVSKSTDHVLYLSYLKMHFLVQMWCHVTSLTWPFCTKIAGVIWSLHKIFHCIFLWFGTYWVVLAKNMKIWLLAWLGLLGKSFVFSVTWPTPQKGARP